MKTKIDARKKQKFQENIENIINILVLGILWGFMHHKDDVVFLFGWVYRQRPRRPCHSSLGPAGLSVMYL